MNNGQTSELIVNTSSKHDGNHEGAPIKSLLATLLVPPLRTLRPWFENFRKLRSYLTLSTQLCHKVPASVVVLGPPEVHGTGDIKLGENLLLYPALYLETQPGASLQIGDNVVISRGVHIVAHYGVTIGADSMIGEYTSIRDANHQRDAQGFLRDRGELALPIVIGQRVWIGRGVTILPGVSIGDDVTVGANAVVRRDVPSGTTVVGIPAAPIGARQRASS